jgi:molybdopterin-guanine dinucleotide biosynthesis protein A
LQKKFMTAIILSGGQSTRMGRDKALVQIDGIPMIQRAVDLLNPQFEEVLIIGDRREAFPHLEAKVYPDHIPGLGALGGLYTGLRLSSFPYAFCVACDMPFLKSSLIDYLVDQAGGFDAVVPRTADGFQPLHAVYSKACVPAIEEIISQKRIRIFDFYPLVKVRFVEEMEFLSLDPLKESFINVNTPEELASLQAKRTVC